MTTNQCCSITEEKVRCTNECFGKSKHCAAHHSTAKKLYFEYKHLSEYIKIFDINKKFSNVNEQINYISEYHILLVHTFFARLEHRYYAIAPECYNDGHDYQFKHLRNKLIECEKILGTTTSVENKDGLISKLAPELAPELGDIEFSKKLSKHIIETPLLSKGIIPDNLLKIRVAHNVYKQNVMTQLLFRTQELKHNIKSMMVFKKDRSHKVNLPLNKTTNKIVRNLKQDVWIKKLENNREIVDVIKKLENKVEKVDVITDVDVVRDVDVVKIVDVVEGDDNNNNNIIIDKHNEIPKSKLKLKVIKKKVMSHNKNDRNNIKFGKANKPNKKDKKAKNKSNNSNKLNEQLDIVKTGDINTTATSVIDPRVMLFPKITKQIIKIFNAKPDDNVYILCLIAKHLIENLDLIDFLSPGFKPAVCKCNECGRLAAYKITIDCNCFLNYKSTDEYFKYMKKATLFRFYELLLLNENKLRPLFADIKKLYMIFGLHIFFIPLTLEWDDNENRYCVMQKDGDGLYDGSDDMFSDSDDSDEDGS